MDPTSSTEAELEFSRNYRIPKRNPSNGDIPAEKSPLEDACDPSELNIPPYSSGGTSTPFPQQNNVQRLQQQRINSHAPKSDYDDLPQLSCYSTPRFQPSRSPFPSNQNPFQMNQQPFYNYQMNPLKRPREVPKNNSNGAKYADSFPHHSDPSLPRELTEQFQPLFCKLCNAQLSSNSMAKLHYKSKNHEKKVRKFLVDYAERTGEPLHERAQVSGCKKQKVEEDNDPKYFHCNVCDLPLTGRLHAESHYMGRNHQKALAGKAPAGKGHFNDDGKWVRRSLPVAVPSQRDSFGLDFVTLPPESSGIDIQINDLKTLELHCEMCDVKVTSQQQMALHISGQKHKKRLQQQASDRVDEDGQGDPENSILSTLSSNIVPSGDLSVYRTPTGYYYCNPCNLTLNSEIQFKQHLGSKKHRKKASGSKE